MITYLFRGDACATPCTIQKPLSSSSLSLSLRVFSLRSRCYNLFRIFYPLNKLGLEFIMRICDYIFEYAYHTLSNIEQHSKWVEILLFRLNWQNLNGKKTKTWKKITKDLDFLASNLYFIHSTKYVVLSESLTILRKQTQKAP